MNQDSTPSVAATVGLSRKIGAAVAAFAALGAGTAVAQQVVYVDDDAPPGGDGQSWETAFRAITDGIDALSGTTFQGAPGFIRVAQGTYHVTDESPSSVDALVLQSGMTLIGGFRGLSPGGAPGDRDPGRFRTVLDANYSPGNRSAEGVHVPAFATVVIDGIHFRSFAIDHIIGEIYSFLTIRNCSFASDAYVGHVFVSTANRGNRLVMEHCQLDNSPGLSALVNAKGSQLVALRDCAFTSLQGGGALVRARDTVVVDIEGCTFIASDNAWFADIDRCSFVSLRNVEARGCNTGWQVAPVRVHSALVVDVDGCVFEGNSSDDLGGALHVEASVAATVSNSRFTGNGSAGRGGALFIGPSWIGDVLLDGCLFADNGAGTRGGAVFSRARLQIRNCTFADNITGAGGAAIEHEWNVPEPTLHNSIVWGNGTGGVQTQVIPYSPDRVTDSLLPSGPLGLGCVAADPLFLAPGDYRLSPGSPAINLGFNPAFDPLTDQFDLAGNPRVSGGFVDAGCYEATLAPGCGPADLALTAVRGQAGYRIPDGTVGSNDFFVYLEAYHRGDAAADLTSTGMPGTPGYGVPNGLVTSEDFFYYLMLYEQGC